MFVTNISAHITCESIKPIKDISGRHFTAPGTRRLRTLTTLIQNYPRLNPDSSRISRGLVQDSTWTSADLRRPTLPPRALAIVIETFSTLELGLRAVRSGRATRCFVDQPVKRPSSDKLCHIYTMRQKTDTVYIFRQLALISLRVHEPWSGFWESFNLLLTTIYGYFACQIAKPSSQRAAVTEMRQTF